MPKRLIIDAGCHSSGGIDCSVPMEASHHHQTITAIGEIWHLQHTVVCSMLQDEGSAQIEPRRNLGIAVLGRVG